MVESPEVPEFRVGESVGTGLRVEALLGQGGAGAVYRVRVESTGARLALKQVRPPADEHRALVISQFEREYRTLSQLAHPRIIEVFDYGFARGSAYYTMELLDGEDLRERGKLPWRTACALLCDVASSLAIVHSRGLVHRDVSARNVRCTADGRAKLLDFGAMVAMGVSHRAVGTPPFTPPETLQLQALDGRADLYALGAVAYFLLTGRNAYPAHSFHQLRDLWRTPLLSPREYEPELPEPLCDLVLAMLRLDRAERPSSAAEVMERLSGIAGLPLQELPQVGRAYLTMPKLIGRDAALQEVRAALLQAGHQGRGGGLLITGAAGSGRSRMLDACILEAKVIGATVLRAGAADAADGDYGVARALCLQLLQAMPEPCHHNAQPRIGLLGHVVPELADASFRPRVPVERRHLQAALRDFLLAIARDTHVVIAVDDCDAIDEPSAAWLGALAHGAKRRRLSLLLTTRTAGRPGAALALLRELLPCVELAPLLPAQTHAMLSSLFGDSQRLAALADRLHHVAAGNPRRIMTLVEHVVARGLARYEAGSWALPVELTSADLPPSDGDAARQRVAGLSTRARALAEVLSLTDVAALKLADFAALSEQDADAYRFGALDELVAAGILIAEGERHRLGESDGLAPLAAQLDARRQRELHARLARVLQGHAPLTLILRHMLHGGLEREAIDRLLSRADDGPQLGRIDVLRLAVEAAERIALPLSMQLRLQHVLVQQSATAGRLDLFERYGWPLIARLERDSGLLDWCELDAALPAAERLERSFERARQRQAALPEAERGFSPRDSALKLVPLYAAVGAVGALTRDVTLLERLRPLEPWLGLSPAVGAVHESNAVQRAMHSGCIDVAIERAARLLEKLPAANDADALAYLRLGMTFLLSALCASIGDSSYARWATELERHPGNRGNAWRARMIYQFAQGNLDRARECQRRAELLDLQDTGMAAYPGSTIPAELVGYAYGGDLLGVKRVIERLEGLCAVIPAWRTTLYIGRCRYKWMQGQLEEALEALQPALAAVAPGRSVDWPMAADTNLELLVALGRHEEAAVLGKQQVAECERLGLGFPRDWLIPSLGLALIKTGELELARELLDACIARWQRCDRHGRGSSRPYATRARLAIAMRDEAGLRHYAQLCAQEYSGAGDNPTIRGNYERLMREGAAAGVVLPAQSGVTEEGGAAREAARTVYSRMLTCISPGERAQTGLQLLLEATAAKAGYLYGMRGGKLRLLASADENDAPGGMLHTLESYMRRSFEAEAALAPAAALGAAPLDAFVDELGREFSPLMLCGTHQGESMIAGVAALHLGDDERPQLRRAMLEAVIEALIAQDIVDPITTHIA